jgi:hypothetical protein
MEKTIKINNKNITLRRLRLREWSKLEEVKRDLDEVASIKDYNGMFLQMVKFIEATIVSNVDIDWNRVPWYEFLLVYSEAIIINTPTIDFPILHGKSENREKYPWEYKERSWYFWLNLFAKHYGWTEEIISQLDIDTAIGLYQEIEIDGQLQREWEWGLSEIAYPYNKGTKKREYKPLARPSWMKPIIPKQLPMVRIRKDMMPMGLIKNMETGEERIVE